MTNTIAITNMMKTTKDKVRNWVDIKFEILGNLKFFTYKKQCWQWLQWRLIQLIFLLLEFQSVRFLQFFLQSYYLDIPSSLKILLQFGQFLQLNIELWKGSMLYATWNMVILVTDPWHTIGIFFLEFFTMTFCRWFYIGLGLGTFLAKTNISLSIKNMPIETIFTEKRFLNSPPCDTTNLTLIWCCEQTPPRVLSWPLLSPLEVAEKII